GQHGRSVDRGTGEPRPALFTTPGTTAAGDADPASTAGLRVGRAGSGPGVCRYLAEHRVCSARTQHATKGKRAPAAWTTIRPRLSQGEPGAWPLICRSE